MESTTQISNLEPNNVKSHNLAFILLKLIGIVFACFFSFGAAIAVIPIYIKTNLQFGSFVISIIIALQYLSTLLSRAFAGNLTDSIGGKTAILWGSIAAIICGLMHWACAATKLSLMKLFFIAIGRVILGISESLIITGALAWALNQAGHKHAGRIMAWNGNAMYAGIALGALGGSWLINNGGFLWVAYASILSPSIAGLFVWSLENYPVSNHTRLPFYTIIRNILLPGIGLLLATLGYGVILSFLALLFQTQHWPHAERGIAAFGLAYVLVRFFFSGLPDRYGGAQVAFYAMLIEAIGQGLIFLSNQQSTVIVGCLLTGTGFSLVVPSLGIEAIKRTPVHNRGAAMGGFLAFFDLCFCIAIPLAGFITHGVNYQIVYLLGAFSALIGMYIAWKLLPPRKS